MQNIDKAVYWWEKAAAQGDDGAKKALNLIRIKTKGA